MKRIILLVLIGIFLMPFVEATIEYNINTDMLPSIVMQGETEQYPVVYIIDNDENNSLLADVSVENIPFITPGIISIQVNANSIKSDYFNLIFSPTTSHTGSYSGNLIVGDETISLSVLVEEAEPVTGCRLIELPHTTRYRIRQGETDVSSQIRIKVSTECPTLSMDVNEETQMSKPMFLQGQTGEIEPGGEFSFTIGLDADGVETGTYSNTYIVSGSAGDDVYQKIIHLSTIVTISTSPSTNASFATMPTCSLDATEMQLNKSYKLTCSGRDVNLRIKPQFDPEFFKGIYLEISSPL